MKKTTALLMIVSLVLIGACQKEQVNISVPSEKEARQIVPVGNSLADSLIKALKGKLVEAMQEGGPTYAVKFCNRQALPLTKTIRAATDAGWQVKLKRTSFKYRNPRNAPDTAEASALRYFEAIAARKENLPDHYLQKVSKGKITFYRYYKPLKVGKVCLTCHGQMENMDQELKATLKALYPKDRATGYRAGDFRGVVSVTLSPRRS